MSLMQRFATERHGPERQAEAVIAFGGFLDSLGVTVVAGRH